MHATRPACCTVKHVVERQNCRKVVNRTYEVACQDIVAVAGTCALVTTTRSAGSPDVPEPRAVL
jgi:hypothetical protein